MSVNDPAFRDHLAWLGYLQPDGLVVSPAALIDSQIIIDRGQTAGLQQRLAAFTEEAETDKGEKLVSIGDIPAFLCGFLDWPEDCLWGIATERPIPDTLRVPLRELDQDLAPTLALRDPKTSDWIILVKILDSGTPLDQRHSENTRSWNASEYQRFERLLRETGVTIGLLTNHRELRLVYAPRGESAGHITFPVSAMGEVSGRLILGAFHQLLKGYALLTAPTEARLPALLKKSRDYQANVSTKLAEQVVEALYELLRGFRAADGQTHGELLATVMEREPNAIYRGLLNSLLRIVFLLYAEDRGLMPTSGLYVRNYSVHGLFERLRADAERYPDTMDHRYGAWSQLLAVFRLVFNGSKNPLLVMPPRRGYLFDPEPFPFLEGRNLAEPAVPLVPDGTLFRVLSNLLLLDGERLSYKTLDVEQIGSVYETIMGFRIESAPGCMIALKPKKRHGAPLHIDLDALAAQKPSEREKSLAELADTKLPDAAAKALKAADSVDGLLAALEKRIDKRATPSLAPAGSIILQPTDERRRSGSHYTPRSFTEPIVRKTLEPILARLGEHPKPEQILELKIADIAVGSAAFLVETCRQLADLLVASWHHHGNLPRIPEDEDEVLYARRIVAQRCLYGVDRNPMAVDLAKLSLWLATMAKDHPFTFLDHSIKCGDSLVGLTSKQIAAFHWDVSQAKQRILGQDQMEKAIKRVAANRKEILDWPEDNEWGIVKKREFLGVADEAANPIRTTGDLAIAAFFNGTKPKDRQQLRDEYLEKRLESQRGQRLAELLPWQMGILKALGAGEHPVRPFHWEIEFPEVFSRENPGFDGIVGNPPFLGGTRISTANGSRYKDWVYANFNGSGDRMDLVAYFFRRAFRFLSKGGALGLIATNTIAQGDTRKGGLSILAKEGGEIYAARTRVKWPGDAAVIVSVVHVFKGAFSRTKTLENRLVPQITSFLFTEGGSEEPEKLGSNADISFEGMKPYGQGFIFDDCDPKSNPLPLMQEILSMHPECQEVIFPYLSGEEVNDHPLQKPTRFIINFGQRSLPECQRWHPLLKIVEERVRPERLSKSVEVAKRPWWQFFRPRGELSDAVRNSDRMLGVSRVGNQLAFTFLPSEVVPSEALVIFPFSNFSAFTVFQARPHEVWARFFASSMKDDLRYTPTDCLETFPFPPDWDESETLEESGNSYYIYRADLMLQNSEGLTKTYNRFHDPKHQNDPAIKRLHELHAAMDRAVLDAYGWTDIPTDCHFLLDYEEDEDEEPEGRARKKKKPWRYRWPDEIRDEVLARLLALNAQRHAEEVSSGAKKTSPKKPGKATRKKKIAPPILQTAEPQLPDEIRYPSPSADHYAVLFITAILSARPGGIPLHLLRDAFVAVTRPSILEDLALPEEKIRVAAWKRMWNEAATPHHLIPALNSLGSANLAVDDEEQGLDAIVALQDGPKEAPTPFLAYDAWLALRVVEPLSAPIPLPDEDSITEDELTNWLQTV